MAAAATEADRKTPELQSNGTITKRKPALAIVADVVEEDGDDSDEDGKPKKAGNQGRRKIDIEYIEVSCTFLFWRK